MPNAHSSFDNLVRTSFTAATFLLCPVPDTDSSLLLAWFVHPSLLHHYLAFVPCLMHTSPLQAWLVHPSLLHRLTFAPCEGCANQVVNGGVCMRHGCKAKTFQRALEINSQSSVLHCHLGMAQHQKARQSKHWKLLLVPFVLIHAILTEDNNIHVNGSSR